MSKKSRERRKKNKLSLPDDYFSNGIIEVGRFGKNTVIKNNSSEAEQTAITNYLCSEFPKKYAAIVEKVARLKQEVVKCDPFSLLKFIRDIQLTGQINVTSEIEYSRRDTMLITAQEYVQSILVSTESQYDPNKNEDQDALFNHILIELEELYTEITLFYNYWAAKIKSSTSIDDARIIEMVESQTMYLVRGNRYQLFELEPLKRLLPPHDNILLELFGVSSKEIISGLERLRYSLSQGYADAFMDLTKEYEKFALNVRMGMSEEEAMQESTKTASKIISQVFGGALIDVEAVTGWDQRFTDMLSYGINEYPDFWDTSEFSGWPIVQLPVTHKPFIKIAGKSYAFLYYALFDHIYRNIQKGITHLKPEYLNDWREKQTVASEEMVKEIFLKLLPGATAYVGNYYPVNTSTKQMNENDIIIIYYNYLFIIEVKAGSFPDTPPIIDFDAHIRAYKALAEKADSQCSRTISYISKNSSAQFYDREKQPTFCLPQANTFDTIFTFSVTVDNFNEFAAKAEKLSVIKLKEETIVISYDDLLAYAGYFDDPIIFLHYLKQRKAALRIPEYEMIDELDHLGIYIDQNLYATKFPFSGSGFKNVFLYGYRKPLDEYFSWLFVDPSQAKKPMQAIPDKLLEIIRYLALNITPENIAFAHFLLNMSSNARQDLEDQINYAINRQKKLKRMIVLNASGEVKYCTFVSIPRITEYPTKDQIEYTYALSSRNEAMPVMWISLKYDGKGDLIFVDHKKCSFSDLDKNEIEKFRELGREKAKDLVAQYRKVHGKIGRNDPCPCGSGKKYKFCCINVFED